jgi:hypothetical protein
VHSSHDSANKSWSSLLRFALDSMTPFQPIPPCESEPCTQSLPCTYGAERWHSTVSVAKNILAPARGMPFSAVPSHPVTRGRSSRSVSTLHHSIAVFFLSNRVTMCEGTPLRLFLSNIQRPLTSPPPPPVSSSPAPLKFLCLAISRCQCC